MVWRAQGRAGRHAFPQDVFCWYMEVLFCTTEMYIIYIYNVNVYHGSIECSYMCLSNVFISGLWDVISPLQLGDGRV